MSSLTWRRPSRGVPMRSASEPAILPTLSGEGYGLYRTRRTTFALSFFAHALAVLLLMASGEFVARHREQIRQQVVGIVTDVSPYVLPPSSSRAGGGGGGGDRDRLPDPRGALPRLSREQVAPPAVIVRNEAPKLPSRRLWWCRPKCICSCPKPAPSGILCLRFSGPPRTGREQAEGSALEAVAVWARVGGRE